MSNLWELRNFLIWLSEACGLLGDQKGHTSGFYSPKFDSEFTHLKRKVFPFNPAFSRGYLKRSVYRVYGTTSFFEYLYPKWLEDCRQSEIVGWLQPDSAKIMRKKRQLLIKDDLCDLGFQTNLDYFSKNRITPSDSSSNKKWCNLEVDIHRKKNPTAFRRIWFSKCQDFIHLILFWKRGWNKPFTSSFPGNSFSGFKHFWNFDPETLGNDPIWLIFLK